MYCGSLLYNSCIRNFSKEGPPAIALPISLQSLITIGVNMMDTIMLGNLGDTAISASALANQFINIFHICCMGMGMGASVLTSRFWGMQDKASLRKAVRSCCGFAFP